MEARGTLDVRMQNPTGILVPDSHFDVAFANRWPHFISNMAAKNESTPVLLAWSKMVPISQAQDPLGLSLRVSARLSSELLHCITSVTPRARYFSFLPWCVSDYAKREKAVGANVELIEAVRLREKALTMGCVMFHNGEARDGSLVGSDNAKEWVAANPDKTPKLSKIFLVKDPALKVYKNSIVQLGFFVETPDELLWLLKVN
jgi:hypothetical protein